MAMDASRVSEEGPAPRKKNSPAPQRAKTATAAANAAQKLRPGPAGFSGTGSRHVARAVRLSSGFMAGLPPLP